MSAHTMTLGAVSYLNAIPLVRGLKTPIRRAPPATLERLLKTGEIELATAPVTTLFDQSSWRAIPGMAIGTKQAAKSVLLCTRSPEITFENVESIYVDMESSTSAQLIKVLLAKKYGRPLESITLVRPIPSPDVQAKMIIGDKALSEHGHPTWPEGHCYDLGQEWTEWTGLPFVFACWVTNQATIDMNLVEELQTTLRRNLKTIDSWIGELTEYDATLLREYFTEHMNYGFDAEEQEGLMAFHQYLRELEIVDRPFELRFINP